MLSPRALFQIVCVGMIISVLETHAQITLTRDQLPRAGDSAQIMNARLTLPGTRYAATGPGSNWDFSDLQPLTPDLVWYRPGIQTPYFLFLNAFGTKVQDSLNLVVVSLQNVFEFYNVNNSRWAAVGRGFTVSGIPIPSFYTDNDEIFFFPLTYGRKDSSTFAYKIGIPTVGEYASRGGRVTQVDGWGSITTPQGTFECLRIKSTLRILDSLTFQGNTIGVPLRTEIEYYWLSREERIPILKVRGTSFFGLFNPTLVQYRFTPKGGVPPPDVPVADGDFLLYPNPTDRMLYVAVGRLDQIRRLQLMDQLGRVFRDIPAPVRPMLDLDDVQAGIYTVRAECSYGTYVKKVVVAR
ncbi:MAG: T9SS type A sorting domain-containing protein [Sphingomonadales bacterium]|nr:T9SS type A sorting domain-containing protein [Sphingomonadales bacterium]